MITRHSFGSSKELYNKKGIGKIRKGYNYCGVGIRNKQTDTDNLFVRRGRGFKYGRGYWNKCINFNLSNLWHTCTGIRTLFRSNTTIRSYNVGPLLSEAARQEFWF